MWSPSGRKTGQRWLFSAREASSSVSTRAGPPEASTISRPSRKAPENTMRPSGPQAPPRGDGASATTCGGLPLRSTRFSLPSAKNATSVPSGDQNGMSPPSAPDRRVGVPFERSLSQSAGTPVSSSIACSTSRSPPGESANPAPSEVPGGGSSDTSRRLVASVRAWPMSHRPPKTSAASAAAAATSQAGRALGDGADETAASPEGRLRITSGSLSSTRASPMSRNRCFGSRSRHRRTSPTSAGGVSAGSAANSGSRISTAASVVEMSSPSNARRPVSIS